MCRVLDSPLNILADTLENFAEGSILVAHGLHLLVTGFGHLVDDIVKRGGASCAGDWRTGCRACSVLQLSKSGGSIGGRCRRIGPNYLPVTLFGKLDRAGFSSELDRAELFKGVRVANGNAGG